MVVSRLRERQFDPAQATEVQSGGGVKIKIHRVLDGTVFLFARWRMAVQQRVALLIEHAMDLDLHTTARLHFGGLRGVKLALAQSRHHH